MSRATEHADRDGAVTAAVIGLAGCPDLLLEALSAGGRVHLAGVADENRARVEQVAAARGVAGWVDARRMLAELQHVGPLDALVLAVGQSEAAAALSLALERRVHVLKVAPLAATLEAAAQWVRLFAAEGLHLRVGRPWRTHRCLAATEEWLEQLGRLALVEARIVAPHADPLGWRADCERAGAGALLATGLEMVDLIGCIAGAPDQVVAVTGRNAARSQGLPTEIEDTALLLLKYESGLTGTLVSTWATGPADRMLRTHGAKAVLEATDRRARLLDADGKTLRARRARPDAWQAAYRQMTDNFAALLGGAAPPRPDAAILWNMAAIEAAYLSARTDQPESPQSLFEMHHIPLAEDR